jgi:hypothetical protein
MVKHFTSLNNDIAPWIYRALSGYVPSIAIMLLTLLPCVANMKLLLHEDTPFSEPLNDINRLLFGVFESSTALALLLVFRSPLRSVKRLRLSSGNMKFLHLPLFSVEIIELDLGVERASSSSQFLSTRSNNAESLYLPAYPRLVYPRLRTLILYSDWSELLPFSNRLPVLAILLRMITGPQLQRLEFYIKWSPRKARTKDCSLEHVFVSLPTQILVALPTDSALNLEVLKVDYIVGPEFNPRACLGDFSRAASFRMFPRLKDIIILQEAIFSCNYRRSTDWKWDIASFFPPGLETITIIYPTTAVLYWLRNLQLARPSGVLKHLRQISLLCRCGHGASPDDFQSDVTDQCFSVLSDVGVLVKLVKETPGAFAKQARKEGSVWEADWAESDWMETIFGADD